MTDQFLPPVRERNRYGLRSFLSVAPPEPAEALFDKVVIRVRGSVQARDEAGLTDFASLIGTSPTADLHGARLFGAGSWRGHRWSARHVGGTTISGGDITLHRRREDLRSAGIDLNLWINPIRTFSHLLDRFRFDEILDLPPDEFFRPSPQPTGASHTLDRRDNMIGDFLSFSGTTHAGMVQRVATFLTAFEHALRQRLLLELCPPEQGYQYADDENGDIVARRDDLTLRLDWGSTLTVSQCEVCWERHDRDALARVHALADAALIAARSVEVQTYRELVGATIERVLGALSVKLPLVPSLSGIALVIYAKAPDRLRFEVRYGDIPQDVRNRLPRTQRSLNGWFEAFSQDAAPRVPWWALRELLDASITPPFDALAELLSAVADVTGNCRGKRQGLLARLLQHGAVTATGRDGDAPSGVLERLQNRGVVEHVRLVRRDPKVGRRYRLTARYAALVDCFTSG